MIHKAAQNALPTTPNGQSQAREALIRQIRKIGIRELTRFGCGRWTLEKICSRVFVNNSTLQEWTARDRELKMLGGPAQTSLGTGQQAKRIGQSDATSAPFSL